MEKQYGKSVIKSLAPYQMVPTITKSIATKIVETLWRGAPAEEKAKAIMICWQYQLNPLMKHIHLVKYKKWNKEHTKVIGEDWSIQIGIGATRLMAHRKHNYTYLDFTPRIATQKEIDAILGDQARDDQIYSFVHIKDLDTGAEAFGLRGYERNATVVGADKGNTPLNMSCGRSERQALDRQYPGEMPGDVETMDERFMDGVEQEVTTVEGESRDLDEEPQDESNEPEPTLNQEKAGSILEATQAASIIDMTWLRESLSILKSKKLKAWADDNVLKLINSLSGQESASIEEGIGKLSREKAEIFCKRVQDTLDMA